MSVVAKFTVPHTVVGHSRVHTFAHRISNMNYGPFAGQPITCEIAPAAGANTTITISFDSKPPLAAAKVAELKSFVTGFFYANLRRYGNDDAKAVVKTDKRVRKAPTRKAKK